ncbi:hypothetical protein, partial [Klebsiella pneumoniae]
MSCPVIELAQQLIRRPSLRPPRGGGGRDAVQLTQL